MPLFRRGCDLSKGPLGDSACWVRPPVNKEDQAAGSVTGGVATALFQAWLGQPQKNPFNLVGGLACRPNVNMATQGPGEPRNVHWRFSCRFPLNQEERGALNQS